MRILIVSATEKEINLIIDKIASVRKRGQWLLSGNMGHLEVEFLIAGVGLPSVMFRLTSLLLQEKYDLVINAGIAGSFKSEIPIGTVVNVITERFGDIGIDDQGQFKTLFETGLLDQNSNPYTCGTISNNCNKLIFNILQNTPKTNGITVNTTSGSAELIEKRKSKFSPDTESMEGAGVFYVCQLLGFQVIQIRSISNMVEPRNLKNWNVPKALMNLSDSIIHILKQIEDPK